MPDKLEVSIIPWVGKTGKMLAAFIEDKFKEHNFDLTLKQFIILRRLHQRDGQSQQKLSFLMNRHKASITRILGTLERRNFVARVPHPEDKRIKRILLTSDGKNYFETTAPILEEAISQIEYSLSEEEKETFINISKKIQKNLEML